MTLLLGKEMFIWPKTSHSQVFSCHIFIVAVFGHGRCLNVRWSSWLSPLICILIGCTNVQSLKCNWLYVFELHVFFFISIVFSNARLEYASVFHKSSLKICLKYAYPRTFKGANFIIWPTPEDSELVKGIKMKKLLEFAPSRLLKSQT